MIKTNIKMRVTPEQSKRVQEICFENGIEWAFYSNEIQDSLEEKYLYIRDFIKFGKEESAFIECMLEEIDADLFIRTNGACNELEETYLTKYASQPKDLESALKKIENLHIALNKKVEKNKNQALEITKLLEQKKDLQEINDSHGEYIKELENRLDELSLSGANTNDTNNYIDDLRNRLKEKDIIISYLRSELK